MRDKGKEYDRMIIRTTDGDKALLRRLPVSEDCEQWPFSFVYNGTEYRGVPNGIQEQKNSEITTAWTKIGNELMIRAEVRVYQDFPAAEWTVWFRNDGERDSGILEQLHAADLDFPGRAPTLITNSGDTQRADGYTDTETVLGDGVVFCQTSAGGRPCQNAFPYQRLLFDDCGYHIAIGWPGQWTSRWTGSAKGVHLDAGQETLRTVLHPGETIRTPLMCVMAFEGDLDRGINLWRRWYFEHVIPRVKGEPVPFMISTNEGKGIEFTETTEEQQTEAIDRLIRAGIQPDLWWIDAGWYPCILDGKPVWQKTGTWEPDPARYPHGLGPVGRKAKEAGMQFLTWFEPERVYPGTWLAEHHPEWMLHREHPEEVFKNRPENMLLNLAEKDCTDWLIDHVTEIIRASGITVYRQDFNISPLPFWRENEKENREGILENQYVQGYLRYWDALREAFPDLIIDSCASGGRRNDLESMKRAVPLHQTDYGYGHHPTKQKYAQHLYSWIPYFRGFAHSWDLENGDYVWPDWDQPAPHLCVDEFDLLNTIAPMMAIVSYVRIQDHPEWVETQKQIMQLYREVRHLLKADFYSMGERHCDPAKWSAWQFNAPESREGMLQFFRNTQSSQESFTAVLKGLEPETEYVFRNAVSGECRKYTGRTVMKEGFVETLDRRSASVWVYTAC